MPDQISQTTSTDDSESLNFLTTLQSIATKHELNPYAKGEEVIYEFTHDPALLHQYYNLRETVYRKSFGLKDFDGGEDFYDKLSHILIARRGNLCLGGCRLTIREGDEAWLLPTEVDEYIFRDLFPDFELDSVRHGEISRFVIMEDSGKDDDIFYGLCKAMYERVVISDINYLFASSTYSMARNWRFIANNFGVRTTKIMNGIHPPDKVLGEDIKWYLTVSDLTSFCNQNLVRKNAIKKFYHQTSEILN